MTHVWFTSWLLWAGWWMAMMPTVAWAEIRLDRTALSLVSATSLLKISGVNRGKTPEILVVRADDQHAPRYAERANLERVIPSGTFQIEVPFATLRTPAGRQLALSDLKQLIVFAATSHGALSIEKVWIVKPPSFGTQVYAWDLGPEGSAVWPGFEPLTPQSPLLRSGDKGIVPIGIDRSARMQAADALTIDGIRGLSEIHLPLPEGTWDITVWLREAGEWEYLPHPLKRSIRVHPFGRVGQVEPVDTRLVYQQNLSPQQWIKNVYLRGRALEASPNTDSWTHFGQRAQDRVTFRVTSQGHPVLLTLDGDSLEARFLSAIFVAPADQPHWLATLTRQRATWWRQNWPVAQWQPPVTGVRSADKSSWSLPSSTQPNLRVEEKDKRKVAAPGTSVLIHASFAQGQFSGAPLVILTPPQQQGERLPATWHWRQWQWQRTHLSSTLLQPNHQMLRHGPLPLSTGASFPRQLVIRVDIPQQQPAGLYVGQLQVRFPQQQLSVPLTIQVVDVDLPALTKPVGIYLEQPAHFGWFPTLAHLGHQAMQCDIRFLHRLGLTGISPPYPTPVTPAARQSLMDQSERLQSLGFVASLAYAPLKRLVAAVGVSQAAHAIAEIEQAYHQKLQTSPYWSIADEPSNPGHRDQFRALYRHLKLVAPDAKLAGHLNHAEDRDLLPLFDLVLINDGFGVDVAEIQAAQSEKRQVWLYNLNAVRAATGFYLWRSGADGVLQWHGRMPTADPFDPTDGREVDVQWFYPSAEPCPQAPDLHEHLYDMMQGIVDARWLLWLDQQAQRNPKASALRQTLHQSIPTHWQAMQHVPSETLDQWRAQILQLVK